MVLFSLLMQTTSWFVVYFQRLQFDKLLCTLVFPIRLKFNFVILIFFAIQYRSPFVLSLFFIIFFISSHKLMVSFLLVLFPFRYNLYYLFFVMTFLALHSFDILHTLSKKIFIFFLSFLNLLFCKLVIL